MKQKISVILLSGGQGQRFGNRDKGLIPWKGKPMVEYVLESLREQSDQIIISCNRNIERYRQYGLETFVDHGSSYRGPLAGIAASSPSVRHPWCLICPSDTPLIPSDLVQRLLIPAIEQDWQVSYPIVADRHYFLPALLRSDILASAEQSLECGISSLHGWYDQFITGTVDFSRQADNLVNVNSPDILEALQ